MKNVFDLEKKLVANGYNVEIVSYGSSEVISSDGEHVPALYRDCVLVCFRSCDGSENRLAKEADFLKLIKRQKDFAIYDKHSVYSGYQYKP